MQSSSNNLDMNWLRMILSLAGTAVVVGASLTLMVGSTGILNRPSLNQTDQALLATANRSEKSPDEVLPDSISAPRRIILPSVNIGLDVDNSTINAATNSWPLSDDLVHYANFTPGLGSERGTLLLYGHNTWRVLRNTGDLKLGDMMYIIDENEKKWSFKLQDQKTIKPEEIGFIYEDTPFRIVMFTCDGWSDEYRRLMFFVPA